MGKYARGEVGEYHIDYLVHKRYGVPLEGDRWDKRGGSLRDIIEYELFQRKMLELDQNLDTVSTAYLVTQLGNDVIKQWFKNGRYREKDAPK